MDRRRRILIFRRHYARRARRRQPQGDYLDPLTEGGHYRLVLADERACGRSDRTTPRQTNRWISHPALGYRRVIR
jgi:pimeloyl-ACP methyl ester carboxylesterase